MGTVCNGVSLTLADGNTDITVPLLFPDHKNTLTGNQTKKSGTACFLSQVSQKRLGHILIIQAVQDLSSQGYEARPQGIELSIGLSLDKAEPLKGIQNGVAFTLVDTDFITDISEIYSGRGVPGQTEEDS